MTQARVRHALITYTTHDDITDRDFSQTAFRDQIVDIPVRAEFDRLVLHGAIIPPDVELQRPGTLLALPESPSEEELLTWVMSATSDEVRQLAADRPNLVARLAGAQVRAEENYKRQMELLGVARTIASEVSDSAPVVRSAAVGTEPHASGVPGDGGLPDPGEPAPGSVEADGGTQEGGTGTTADDAAEGTDPASLVPGAEAGGPQETPDGGTPALTTVPGTSLGIPATGEVTVATPHPATTVWPTGLMAPQEVVTGNVAFVTNFISEHPELAKAILDAEVIYTDGKPRQTVIRAVEAAAGHTQ